MARVLRSSAVRARSASVLGIIALAVTTMAAAPVLLDVHKSPATRRAASSSDGLSTYLVQLAPSVDPGARANALAGAGYTVRYTYRNVLNALAVTVPDAAVDGLRRGPGVLGVTADVPVTMAGPAGSWGQDRIDQRQLPLSGTYSPSGDGGGVDAYIVDTGVYAAHEDFAGRVAAGYTAVNDTKGTEDCNGHGTHVAGTVGGTRYGVAPKVRLIPVRVLGCDGSGTATGVLAGLDWIAGHHSGTTPAVANMSLGSSAYAPIDQAVAALRSDGVIVAVAAGNSGTDACNYSPARAGVALTVAAADRDDTRAYFSNWGTCVDYWAPGVDIISDAPDSPQATAVKSGTSMAAPHVAGVAAQMWSSAPSLGPDAVETVMGTAATHTTVRFAEAGSPDAMAFSSPSCWPGTGTGAPATPTATSASVIAAGQIRVQLSCPSATTPAVTRWDIAYASAADFAGDTGTTVTGAPAAFDAPWADVGGLTDGATYYLRVRGTNGSGSSPWSAAIGPVTVRTTPGTPQEVQTSSGPGLATIMWQAPAEGGVSPVTSYDLRYSTTADMSAPRVVRLGEGEAPRAELRALRNASFGSAGDDSVSALAIGGGGGRYLAGTFTKAMTVGSDRLVPVGSIDGFVARATSDGRLDWGRPCAIDGQPWGIPLAAGADDRVVVFCRRGTSASLTWYQPDGRVSEQRVLADGLVPGRVDALALGGDGTPVLVSGGTVIAVAENGAARWQATLPNAALSDVLVDLDGSVITCGSAQGDALVARLVGGASTWTRTLGGANSDWFSRCALGKDGAVYAGGGFESPNVTSGSSTVVNSDYHADGLVARLERDGSVAWLRSFGASGQDDWAGSVTGDSRGYAVFAGAVRGPAAVSFGGVTAAAGVGSSASFVGAYTPNGDEAWGEFLGKNVSTHLKVGVEGVMTVAGTYPGGKFTLGDTTVQAVGQAEAYVATGQFNVAPGQGRYVQVRARNAIGPGSWSPASPVGVSLGATVTATPGAVPGLRSSTSDWRTLQWDAPADQPVTSYDLRYANAADMSGAVVVPGATVGVPAPRWRTLGTLDATLVTYVQVRASNSLGNGPWSPAEPVTVAAYQAPVTPTCTSSSVTDTALTLACALPSDGGSPITGYQYQLSDQTTTGPWCDTPLSASSTITVTSDVTAGCAGTSLRANTAYLVKVRAVNAAGAGTAASVTSGTAPAPVAAITATAGDRQATITWAAPAGATITRYDIRYTTDSTSIQSTTPTVTATSTSTVISGLTADTTYYFQVRATNNYAAGAWAPDTPSGVTPYALPGTPGTPSVTRTDFGELSLATSAPSSGSAVTSYTFTATPTGTSGTRAACSSAGTSGCTLSGLVGGATYQVTAVATNASGSGPASAPATVTVAGRSAFATSHVGGGVATIDLVPSTTAPTAAGARLVIYLAVDTTGSSGPAAPTVAFPGGGAASCDTSASALAGATKVAGTGLRGGIVQCVISSPVPAGAAVRLKFTTTPARSVALGETITGLPSGGTSKVTGPARGVASVPSSGTGVSVAAGSILLGTTAWEDGTLALAADTDSLGGRAWSVVTKAGTTTISGAGGLQVMRQYKFTTTSATQTYNSTTATLSGEDWVTTLVTLR